MAQVEFNSVGNMFNTPVAIFSFNRPQLTERLIGILAQIKPRRILIVSDGPRPHVADDVEKCAAVRRLFDNLSWNCRIDRNFAESNMGSFSRNSTGISWVFDQVEEAILLEDDCMPDLSFFPYCEELLGKYRDDARVGLISGNNFLNQKAGRQSVSYFFSGYATTWGWASWRSTWQRVNLDMPYWKDFRDSGELRAVLHTREEEKYWKRIYNAIEERRMNNAWDYQLILSCLRFNMLTVVPSVNLVSNIGFGPDGTHCINADSPLNDIPLGELRFPLSHPEKVGPSGSTDFKIFAVRFRFSRKPLYVRIREKFFSKNGILGKLYLAGKNIILGRKQEHI